MSARIHLPGRKPGTAYCGTRTSDHGPLPTVTCQNCRAAVTADQQAAQARKEQRR